MNDNMEWHIMTGSKGGIGKTLLTLLLLGYYLEHKQDGSILVLDLNGMNTDSTAILLYRNLIGNSHSEHLIENKEVNQQGGDQILFQKTYSIIKDSKTNKNQQRHYIAGYPLNPFVLYNPKLFAELLTNLKLKMSEIQKDLKFDLPLKYIFIDTNYHFCNIFGQDDSYYSAYQKGNPLENENFNIWFFWVYRQLEKLVVVNQNHLNESMVVRTTANMIEKHLSGSKEQGFCGGKTPFKHVFSPAALVTSSKNNESVISSLKGLFDAIRGQYDYIIPEFEQLEKYPKGDCVGFETWVEHLQAAYSDLGNKTQQEHALLFLSVLEKAVKMFSNEQRPENIIPISAYLPTLQQYTDKDRPDIIASIRGMKIYRHFSSLF